MNKTLFKNVILEDTFVETIKSFKNKVCNTHLKVKKEIVVVIKFL